jgi:ribonuclease E
VEHHGVKPAGAVEAVVAAVATEKVVVTELQPATDAPELAAQAAAKIETVAPIVPAEESVPATEVSHAPAVPATEPAPVPAPAMTPVEVAPAAAPVETAPVAPVEAAAPASAETAAPSHAASAETAPAAQAAPEGTTPPVEEVPAAAQPVPVIREDVIQAAVPAHEAAVPAAAVPVETAPAATAAVKPRQAAPHANGLSPETLQPMLANAGLVWVNTDADKLRAAQEAAAQVVKPPRAPRERKPLPPADSTPMQQVETVKHPQ